MARLKGSKNKVGETAKENILAVFTRVGGTSRMASWAEDNLTEFYRLYARLIPTEVTGSVEHEVIQAPNESTLAERLSVHLANRTGSKTTTVQ
jgi:hypothetical protein